MRQLAKAVLLGTMATALIALPATAADGDGATKDQAREQVQAQVQNNTCETDCEPVQTRTQEREQARVQDGTCDEACTREMAQEQLRLELHNEGYDGPLTLRHMYRHMASGGDSAYLHRVRELCPKVFMPV
ncbi:MAG: hypothetical protein ABFR95_09925 [Actinomycetota bacterium]